MPLALASSCLLPLFVSELLASLSLLSLFVSELNHQVASSSHRSIIKRGFFAVTSFFELLWPLPMPFALPLISVTTLLLPSETTQAFFALLIRFIIVPFVTQAQQHPML